MIPDLMGIVPEWYALAACAQPGVDPETFFPHPGHNNERDAKAVLRFCESRCEVRLQCGTYAIENQIEHGIWGGLTSQKRRRLAGTKAKSDPPIPKTCRRCGGLVTDRGRSTFCSDTCQRTHKNDYAREYQRSHGRDQRTAS